MDHSLHPLRPWTTRDGRVGLRGVISRRTASRSRGRRRASQEITGPRPRGLPSICTSLGDAVRGVRTPGDRLTDFGHPGVPYGPRNIHVLHADHALPAHVGRRHAGAHRDRDSVQRSCRPALPAVPGRRQHPRKCWRAGRGVARNRSIHCPRGSDLESDSQRRRPQVPLGKCGLGHAHHRRGVSLCRSRQMGNPLMRVSAD